MDEIRTTAEEDTALEAVVLRLLLDLHPTQVSVEELLREVAGGRGGFSHRDAVERAVRELVAAGLAHRNGELVFPSRAALRCDELLG